MGPLSQGASAFATDLPKIRMKSRMSTSPIAPTVSWNQPGEIWDASVTQRMGPGPAQAVNGRVRGRGRFRARYRARYRYRARARYRFRARYRYRYRFRYRYRYRY